MTLWSLLVWCILVTIGFLDAKSYRIPNKLLLLLLGVLISNYCLFPAIEEQQYVLADKTIAFMISFLFGLVLFNLKVMAPGDVKLIAVLGFWLGTGQLMDYLFYVCLMTAFVGPMYWALNRLEKAKQIHISAEQMGSSHFSLAGMAVQMEMGKQQLKHTVSTGQGLTYMPFAPTLIMGLALQQYYA
ncbi:prepilin peptidase [Vibrio alfacsensis]|uniref:prepilin peptidase n=1 Tax=Vibrio alfacsensis TaxID=1074311 RepID=UPI004067FE6E